LDELRSNWQLDRRFVPSMPEAQRERLYARWREAVGRSLDWDTSATSAEPAGQS